MAAAAAAAALPEGGARSPSGPDGGRTAPALCDVGSLRLVRCPRVENGVDWAEFLRLACLQCEPGEQCKELAGSLLLSIAYRVVEAQTPFGCAPGLLAAVIVVAQLYAVNDEVLPPELRHALDRNVSLAPFPFQAVQYSLYMNMLPATLHACNASGISLRAYVPKVHHESSGRCGMVYDDQMLMLRCRSRLQSGQWLPRLDALESTRCPLEAPPPLEPGLRDKLHKYSERGSQPSLQCQSSRGMWREAMSDVHKCVLVTVGTLLGFRPGQLVLDWGSGCGHKLTWAKMFFDVDGLGLDVEGGAVAWARRHSAGTFCHADGRDLSWVPADTFDYVISYAALYHVSVLEQCRTGIHLVSKLRVGGKAFFGWNQLPFMSHFEWRACLVNPHRFDGLSVQDQTLAAGMAIELESMEDGYIFPPDRVTAGEHYLYQYPSYSIFITRHA